MENLGRSIYDHGQLKTVKKRMDVYFSIATGNFVVVRRSGPGKMGIEERGRT
jgi:hypothetical protein